MPKSESEIRSVVSNTLGPQGLYSPWNSPGQNIGVGSLSLLQGIFPTHGSNTGLPHCRQVLYQLSHKRKPRILEWVAYPFSRGSLAPRNQTGVPCIAGGFFTNWASGNLSMPNFTTVIHLILATILPEKLSDLFYRWFRWGVERVSAQTKVTKH